MTVSDRSAAGCGSDLLLSWTRGPLFFRFLANQYNIHFGGFLLLCSVPVLANAVDECATSGQLTQGRTILTPRHRIDRRAPPALGGVIGYNSVL
eukprot:COSAG01_NODE_292_length_19376_cov_61.487239_3_plen_94_part_00